MLTSFTDDLPKGWAWTQVKGIAEFIRGVSYRKNESSKTPETDYVPILRANNINRQLNFEDLVYVHLERVKKEQFVKTLDVIIAMSSGSKHLVGKAAQAYKDFEGGFGTFCGLVRVTPKVDRKLIGLFFQSPSYRNEISQLSIGININNLRRENIESMVIPLPPIAEQRRIVAKLETLFTQLDTAVDNLKKAQTQLKRYRQSLLKAAFEGELTREWRDRNLDESRSTEDSNGLPKDWKITTVGCVIEKVSITEKKLKKKDYIFEGKLPVIDQGLSFIGGYTDNEELKVECKLPVIVFGDHTKAIKYIDFDFVGGADGIKVIKSQEMYRPKLFFYFLRAISIPDRGYSRHYQFLEKAQIPIPPLVEQEQIVSELERYLSVADEAEATVEAELKRSERLRQSILKHAFSGKLVPQDPSDEPASALLEKIREEKGQQQPKRKKTKTRIKDTSSAKQLSFPLD